MGRTKKTKTIPRFATMLSGGKFDVLETIIKDQYEELLCMFRYLKEDLDDIVNLEYHNNDDSNPRMKKRTDSMETRHQLCIEIVMRNERDAQNLFEKLSEQKKLDPISQAYQIDLVVVNNVISIGVFYKSM